MTHKIAEDEEPSAHRTSRAGVLDDETHKARKSARRLRFEEIEADEFTTAPAKAPEEAQGILEKPKRGRPRKQPRTPSPKLKKKLNHELVKPTSVGQARDHLEVAGGRPALGGHSYGQWPRS